MTRLWASRSQLVALPLASCGHKGKLKTPTQAEIDAEKKAHRTAKEEKRAAEQQVKEQARQQKEDKEQGRLEEEQGHSGHDKNLLR